MKLFLLLIIILSVIGILEYKSIIPTTPFGVLMSLATIASFIKSLHIHSYYLVLPDITITVEGILSIFLVLFIIGYVADRFRTLEHKITRLNTEIKNINKIEPEADTENLSSKNEMQQIATDIKGFLETLAQSVTVNPSMPIRSKKIRRVSAEYSNDIIDDTDNDSTEEVNNENTVQNIMNNENKINDIVQAPSVSSDDNLSSIDLAKALIQSDEKDKAKEILIDIIKNGSANDAHEARVLNLQIS